MPHRERMAAADAAWLHMDRRTNLMVINGVLWFDQPVDWNVLRKVIDQRLVQPYPRFRHRAVESHRPLTPPYWEEDPQFDIDNHLHHIALPAPGDHGALQRFVGDRMSVPMDRTKPLWHVYFIDGYGEGCAMLLRVHHSVADGIALAQVLWSLTDDHPRAEITPRPLVESRRGGPTSLLGTLTHPATAAAAFARDAAGALIHESIEVATNPSKLRDFAAAGRDGAAALAKEIFTPEDVKTVMSGETVVGKRAVWSTPIPLADIRTVGSATSTTVNDVLLTAVTGALRRYLERRDSLVDKVRVLVPFNLRPTDRPLPRTLGNKFGLVLLDLPVGLVDAHQRLASIHTQMDAIKHSPEGAVSFGLLTGMGLSPSQVEKVFVDFFTSKASAVMTNVPGPRGEMYLAGTPLRGVIAWVPRSGQQPMGVSIFSYNNEVTVGLAVDAALVPEPETIIKDFRDELAALLRATVPG